MTGGWPRVLAVCGLLVLAGCAAPAADHPAASDRVDVDGPATPTTTTASGDETTDAPEGVVVEGASFDVDVNRTYERVQRLLGADYAGTRVLVRNLTRYKSADYGDVPFFRVFGIEDPALDESQPTGLTTLDASVYVAPAGADSARLEQVLAHEFVHVAQVREGLVPWFGGLSLERVTLDEQHARRALVEGGAVYVTDAYSEEFLPDEERQSAYVEAGYENGSSGDRFVWSQYHFGAQYVDATIDAPQDLAAVYEDAPETTENVLHPGKTDDPAALDVEVTATDYTRVDSRTGRVGELLTRITLRDVTNKSTAAAASEGWGSDRVVVFRDSGTWSIAWVTRWDTAADADEFEAAAGELGTEPGADSEFRVDRHDDDTVVVFAGSDDFLETASASGNVTVTA
jgi:hypothetical protein